MLANLLQELTLAREAGRGHTNVIIQEARLAENPVDRLSRFIRDAFWTNLTRRIDGGNVLEVASDPKDWTANPRPRIYVPHGAPEQYAYYQAIAEKQRQEQESTEGPVEHHKILDVQWLAKDVTPEYIRDLNNAPGLLAVGMDEVTDEKGHKTLQGKPFIVPGGRFNEFYGWDSYMGSLGLIIHKRVDICKSMVENFTFCIQHYGKILNANRSYYLGRSQPPFLTDMVLRVWDQIPHDEAGLDFIRKGTLAAIKEYFNVWTAEPRLDPVTGLSRYRPVGVGVPPETESTHFLHVLEPYAKKHGLEYSEFVKRYNSREILEPELDNYFLHDRAVRESGHDTSYRLEGVAADLATVDLNSCLFKIESDIARIVRFVFDDKLPVPPEFQTKGQMAGHVESSAAWDRRWKKRRVAMDKYMWDEERGMYLDYNTVKKQRTTYESATTFWAMWSGVATPRQAAHMVIKALPKFEMYGGLVSGTRESRGEVGLHRPNRQWDYPFAWAPHQILAWNGMQRYGYIEEAQRLAYRWCHMVTNAFQQFNGIVVEKYDLTRTFDPQRVEAEYGNQGADFKGVPKEGFGWVNASYIVGIDLLTTHQKKVLGTNIDWEAFSKTVDSDIYSEEAVASGTGFPEQAAAERGIPQNYIGPYGTGSGHVGHARDKDSNCHH